MWWLVWRYVGRICAKNLLYGSHRPDLRCRTMKILLDVANLFGAYTNYLLGMKKEFANGERDNLIVFIGLGEENTVRCGRSTDLWFSSEWTHRLLFSEGCHSERIRLWRQFDQIFGYFGLAYRWTQCDLSGKYQTSYCWFINTDPLRKYLYRMAVTRHGGKPWKSNEFDFWLIFFIQTKKYTHLTAIIDSGAINKHWNRSSFRLW